VIPKSLLRDREEGGYLLSRKLVSYKNSNAVVIGIPHGGVCVAAAIAEQLSLPLEAMPCLKIKDPADSGKNIGSVSEDEVFIHDGEQTIPQDYVFHQIAHLRNIILHEKTNYDTGKHIGLRYRPVILVDDVLTFSDTMMACLLSIRKQNPMKIIVAVPVVSAEAAQIISAAADDLQFLKIEASLGSPKTYFENFPRVDEQRVKELLEISKKHIGTSEHAH
ncbi:MAG TPA: phosphoribosyltransferase family protein, partial [Cyclobacteriaceae bacterium]|nr:phosphoribosyltransferase family protein [Cyclobacteriaceae bacterium]